MHRIPVSVAYVRDLTFHIKSLSLYQQQQNVHQLVIEEDFALDSQVHAKSSAISQDQLESEYKIIWKDISQKLWTMENLWNK